MDAWHGFYEGYARAVERQGQQRRRRVDELRDFDNWVLSAQKLVMDELYDQACRRAEEFSARGNLGVTVDRSGNETALESVRVTLGPTQITVYANRGRGGLPWLHFGHSRSGRQPTVMSLPGAFIGRRAGGYVLFRCTGGGSAKETSVDALLLEAFQLLAAANLKVGRAALGAPRATWT